MATANSLLRAPSPSPERSGRFSLWKAAGKTHSGGYFSLQKVPLRCRGFSPSGSVYRVHIPSRQYLAATPMSKTCATSEWAAAQAAYHVPRLEPQGFRSSRTTSPEDRCLRLAALGSDSRWKRFWRWRRRPPPPPPPRPPPWTEATTRRSPPADLQNRPPEVVNHGGRTRAMATQ